MTATAAGGPAGPTTAGRLAGTTWTARELPLAGALAVVRAAGLTAVEVWAEGVHLDPRVPGYQPAAVRRALGDDLSVVSVHLPFHAVAEGEPAQRRTAEWVALCDETLRRGAELGAGIAVAHPVIHRDDGEPLPAGVRRLAGALHRIAGAAAGLGLRLAVENMHELRGPTLRSVAEILAALADSGADPGAGVCLDVGHAIFNGYTGSGLGDEVRAAGGRLRHTHVHDSDRVGADPHLVPGDGIADWPEFGRAIADVGFAGWFVLEVDGAGDPVERLTTARTRFAGMLPHR